MFVMSKLGSSPAHVSQGKRGEEAYLGGTDEIR